MTKTQPAPGDGVLLCAHDPEIEAGVHVFWLGGPELCFRPDGSRFLAEWVLLCDACFVVHAADIFEVPIRSDFVWDDESTIIYRTLAPAVLAKSGPS
jgi:hypothetical protein